MAVTNRVVGQPGLQRFVTGQYSQSQILEARLRSEQVAHRLDTGQGSTAPAPPAVVPVGTVARVQSGPAPGAIVGGIAGPVRTVDEPPPPAPIPGRPILGPGGGGGGGQRIR